jgi:hypothetical protein
MTAPSNAGRTGSPERPFLETHVERRLPSADTPANEFHPTTPMREVSSAVRLNEIQEQIGRGEYRVDAHAVADAIIRRLLQEFKSGSDHKRAQGECS